MTTPADGRTVDELEGAHETVADVESAHPTIDDLESGRTWDGVEGTFADATSIWDGMRS